LMHVLSGEFPIKLGKTIEKIPLSPKRGYPTPQKGGI